MKSFFLFVLCSLILFQSSAQVQELEVFRKKLAFFIRYDQGKTDSITRTEASTARLRKELEESFLQFATHRQSCNLENLKANSKGRNGSSYYFDTYSYSMSELYRDYGIRSKTNNTNYMIGFYGLYDYSRPDFAALFIQPFKVSSQSYLVYSYSLNGQGLYFIKDSATNQIVYKGQSLSSSAAIHVFKQIDQRHCIIVEDLGDLGRRALVLQKTNAGLKAVPAFKGNEIDQAANNFKKKVYKEKRMYMWLASNRGLSVGYGTKYVTIGFDESRKAIFYRKYVNESKGEIKLVEAIWDGNKFEMDDCYLGDYLDDSPVPMPR